MESERDTSLEERQDQVLRRMRDAGLRLTKFRRNLIALLLEEEPYTLSVEEIHSRSTSSSPDLVTVYRNVESLTQIGILDCITDGKGPLRYRLNDLNEKGGTTLKIACRDCHATLVRSSPILPQLESVARDLGYRRLKANWEITGYCEDCSDKHSL